MIEIHKTKELTSRQIQQIQQLWNQEYPVNLKDRFSILLEEVEQYHHYLIEQNNEVWAWAVGFEKDNETRFSLIVSSTHQNKGLGTLLLERLKNELGEFYGWVIDHNNDLKQDGTHYKTPLPFYSQNGFEVLPENRIDTAMLQAVKIKRTITVFAETKRFLLREILPTDLDAMYELDADPEVHVYLGNKPVSTKEQLIPIIQHIRQQYREHGIGRWAIVDKTTHEFVGWSGLKWINESTNNHIHYFDLGYRIQQKHWRKGIATETSQVAIHYAFKTLKANILYAAAHYDNIGSNKILKRLGFTCTETFYYEDILCNWYELKRESNMNK
jgi:ribosomal-protein-alanine N-acetyltransferase